MLRKAVAADVKEIMSIIRLTIEEMRTYGNAQWNESYPQERDFMKDIQNENLFVLERDKQIAGFVCINQAEPAEYDSLNWALGDKPMVVHRMAVNPKFRRNGIGTELMKFTDEFAIKNNIRYLKIDTYSVNAKMNALIKKCHYNFVGKINLLEKEKPFYCYEKILNEV